MGQFPSSALPAAAPAASPPHTHTFIWVSALMGRHMVSFATAMKLQPGAGRVFGPGGVTPKTPSET
jgi:hypothetical protein